MTQQSGRDPAAPRGRGRYLIAALPLLLFAGLAAIFMTQLQSGRDVSEIPSALLGTKAPALQLAGLDGSERAALTSAVMFSIGAALPLGTAALLPASRITVVVSLTSLLFLGVLGGISARAGGARLSTGILRVTIWGALAMGATALIGSLLGVSP